ncbi:MAG: FMN-binding negative transcriptional regulator [Flavobacteriaceae bacterium]
MNYPPAHHQEQNFENAVRLIENCPLGMLLTAEDDQPFCSHLPMIFKPESDHKIIVGHMDIRNPQIEHIKNGRTATIVFNGPETYISPSIYSSSQLPTWNYFKVHIKGDLKPIMETERVIQSLCEMTAFLEPDKAFELPPDHPRMLAFIPHILGFELTIESWEGKTKISQDKHPKDQRAAQQAMIAQNPHHKELIDTLYDAHQTMRP